MELPRDLVVAAWMELRAVSGHWAAGFTSDGVDLVTHDARMPDGGCLMCVLIGALDLALHGQITTAGVRV